MSFGLSESDLDQLKKVFRNHPQIEEVRIFGSRAMGNYKPYSDIDLVLWGEIDDRSLRNIHSELEELPLPYQFDLELYTNITSPELIEHIDQYAHNLYKK